MEPRPRLRKSKESLSDSIAVYSLDFFIPCSRLLVIACNSVLNAIGFLDLLWIDDWILLIHWRKPVLYVEICGRHRSGILYILEYIGLANTGQSPM
jgi:hypothetical protein